MISSTVLRVRLPRFGFESVGRSGHAHLYRRAAGWRRSGVLHARLVPVDAFGAPPGNCRDDSRQLQREQHGGCHCQRRLLRPSWKSGRYGRLRGPAGQRRLGQSIAYCVSRQQHARSCSTHSDQQRVRRDGAVCRRQRSRPAGLFDFFGAVGLAERGHTTIVCGHQHGHRHRRRGQPGVDTPLR